MCTIWWSLIFIKSCPCPELIYRKFFRNQSYGEISTPAGSWGTGAFFEEQIATTGRLCAKLSHHPSTRNFKKTFFSFSVFFLSNFPLHHHLRGESGLSLAGCPYFRSNHIAWVHESMHFLYIFGPQLWTLGAREIPMTFTGLCCDLDLWRSAEDVIGWFWFIFGSYWFYICLEDIQSLNESFLLVAGTSTTYNLSFWIHEAPKNGTKSDPSVGIHRSGCSTPRVGVV